MNSRARIWPHVAAATSLLFVAQCRREQAVSTERSSPSADAARATPVAVPEPSADAAADDAGGPPPSVGEWLDGNIYRFRLQEVRRCAPSGADGAVRLGVLVRVQAKINDLLVAPRDVKLQNGGVIVDSAIITKAPSGCAPSLMPKSVRAGKVNEGVVVFDVPPDFNPEGRPVLVTYQPTRWGGAPRVQAVVPPGTLGGPTRRR